MAIERTKGGRIVRDVKVAIDMNCTSSPLTGADDSDALRVDDIIASRIVEGVAEVEKAAPLWMIDQITTTSSVSITWDKDCEGAGSIILPEGFMRLVSFRMSDWRRPVSAAIDDSSPLYAMQRSRISGVRGSYERPVVALRRDPTGLLLEFYSSKDKDATVAGFAYRPYPTIDEEGGVDVSTLCYKAAVAYIAGLALSTLGDQQGAERMFQLSREEIS